MNELYLKTPEGLCINTDNAPYQHILDRRQLNKRFQKLESEVGGIANSISQLIDMIQRSDQMKFQRNEED
jgi:hypothetical protein